MKLISFQRLKSICRYTYYKERCLHRKHTDSKFYEAGHPMNDFGKCNQNKCPEWRRMKSPTRGNP